MKKLFWRKLISKYVFYTLVAIIFSLIMTVAKGSDPAVLFVQIPLVCVALAIHRAVGSGIEYLVMKRWAENHNLEIEDVLFARYGLGWPLNQLVWMDKGFAAEQLDRLKKYRDGNK